MLLLWVAFGRPKSYLAFPTVAAVGYLVGHRTTKQMKNAFYFIFRSLSPCLILRTDPKICPQAVWFLI